MRIYENCKEAVKDIGRELQKCSSEVHTQTMQNKSIAKDEGYNTRELQAFSFAIINQDDRDEMPHVTKEWCKAEFKERISSTPKNPGEAYKLRKDVWEEFLIEEEREAEEDGEIKYWTEKVFEYTYAERMHWQIGKVIEELKTHPDTRQAIITIHDRKIDQERMGQMRVPCSMFYHFMFRNDKLDIIYNMRSSDFITHFQNDIWLAMAMQTYIAKYVGVEPGKFIMQVSSLHIYQKDWEELQRY